MFIVLRGAAQKKGGVVVRGSASLDLTCKIGWLADMLGPAYWISVDPLPCHTIGVLLYDAY